MFKLLTVLFCLSALFCLQGCRLHKSVRPHGYAAIKAKMSTKEVATVLGIVGSGNPEKHVCGKCDAWSYAGYYIKAYAETGQENVQRFSIFSTDGRLLSGTGSAEIVDPRILRLHPPMRFSAVAAVLGSKGISRTLMAYTWKTTEGDVTVEFENGKAYHKQLLKAGGGQDAFDLCPTAPLWDAPPAKAATTN